MWFQFFFSVLLILLTFPVLSRMKTHVYFGHEFKRSQVPTEYEAFKALQKYPLEQDVNYLAIPWAQLILHGRLCHVPDIKLDGGFSVCWFIQYEKIIPRLKHIGIDVLFTPHVPKGKTYDGIKVLPFPHYPLNGVPPAEHKDILYSFIGYSSYKCVREKILRMKKHEDAVIIRRNRWYFGFRRKIKERDKKQYKNILARSRYSLCPRGSGLGTIRFWESLQAGAIPIVITKENEAVSLPPGFDWNSCAIFLTIKDIDRINDIIAQIAPEQEKSMREQCYKAFEKYCGSNFAYAIHEYYENHTET